MYYSIDSPSFPMYLKCGCFELLVIAAFLFVLVILISKSTLELFGLDTLSIASHAPAKTLGGKLHCDPDMLKPSATIPDDVDKVRPADIKAIAAIGDSFIMAARSTNFLDDPLDIFPGNSFISGGDGTVEEHITVAKILRIFNPTMMEVSYGAGYGNMGSNVATGRATCKDVFVQAKD
ncbi:hypothetical protein DICVIV_11675 [Dictyocaulus viviparus]|uniref:Uncharacterized protein n=1 Tax=Dictyocaulus viviparus TaxID=29172 RepID=A0A0D8XCJ4_DICVI|nr:hypothetical protein DICVIV_11675 [Dictyocaulus viviparus]